MTPNPASRILCYGDSLTAGTSPPLNELFPYGPHLENEIQNLMTFSSLLSTSPPPVVRWRGLPGWTSSAMEEYIDDPNVGLRSAVNEVSNPSLSLVIILAGTNDIGMLTSSALSGVVDVKKAVEPILNLHRSCLECDSFIRTLAVGIPGSAWQESNENARVLCRGMNEALSEFASDGSCSSGRVSYVDFPSEFERGSCGGRKWCGDGLHLTPEGYETLGRGIASSVINALERII
mmetsp:Transcript_10873/g.22645  ORF Transcript_10873/g.22645 Transcript_10873/m.22645 type:complete len:234 (-) Transcript_10873:172-873(-)